MFYRIFGKPGSGKTKFIFDRLSECIKNQKKAFLVVPEQSAVAVEKDVIAKLSAKSNLYVEVINFTRLCNRVFRELGGLTSTHLDNGAKKLLMLLALEDVAPYLGIYSKNASNDNFASSVLDIINELKSSCVTTKALEKAQGELDKTETGKEIAEKTRDILLISEAYNARISKIPGAVTDIYQKLCEKLRENDFFEGCDVFFDSFYGFTEIEYEIISLISQSADNVYVTVPCSKDCDDIIFLRSKQTKTRLERVAKSSGCEIRDIELDKNFRHKAGSGLEIFQRMFSSKLLSGTIALKPDDDSLKTVLCRDIYDEAKCAVSTVLRLIRQGADFSDIAICAKNTSDYIGVLDTAFEKAEIPIGIDIPESLSQSTLFELVTSALEAASTFKSEAILRYTKTGLSGLSDDQADLFETYVRTWDISPSLFRRDEDFTMNPDGYVDTPADRNVLDTVNLARQKVYICLDALSKNIKSASTIKDFCLCIYKLFSDIANISEHNTFYDGNNSVSLTLLYECLDSFVSVAGNEKITLSRFMSLLRGCADDYDTGHIPKQCCEVRFSSIDLLRCPGIKHVIILGANSGIFPSAHNTFSLFSDSERKLLADVGLSLSQNREEQIYDEFFLAYCATASASSSCCVLYSAHDLSGAKLFASPICVAIEKLTSSKPVLFSTENLKENFSSNELLFEELCCLEDSKRKNTLIKYFSSIDEYKERLHNISCVKDQSTHLEKSTLDVLYGDKIVSSYSRIEKMVQCPFAYFCSYTLNLKPQPKAALGPSEAGSIIHKILEELVPVLCVEGQEKDASYIKKLIYELLAKHLSRIAHTDLEHIPKRFVYLYNRLSRLLFEISQNIVNELKVSKFRPVDFELDISLDGSIKPSPIPLDNGRTLYIVGQIDRVDTYTKDDTVYIRITDYKTGKKTFKLKEIEKGLNLQMLLYLAAIQNNGKEKYGKNIIPAGVLYSNVVSASNNVVLGKDDIDALSDEIAKPVSSGIFLDDDEILFAMDPTENSIYLPIGRKDGAVTKKDSVASLEELGQLLDFAQSCARELATQMINGLKSVTPFNAVNEGIDLDPCRYCEMSAVCMKQ